MFLLIFLFGMVGFTTMVAMGSLRGHGGVRSGHGHGLGHGHAGTHALGHGHAAHVAHGSHAGPQGQLPQSHGHAVAKAQNSPQQTGPSLQGVLLTFSPIDIFSVAVGLGATGVLVGAHATGTLLWSLAIAGGILFDFVLVKPLMGFLGSFAASPSQGLEGMVLQEAEAITTFDQRGQGIVRITLDGQHVQLLATLDELERDKGIRVHQGERLIVVDVDTTKNSCRVTRELAS